MSCWTEWDPLEEVIVGDCYSTVDGVESRQKDALNQILEETKEDLNGLVKLLESFNVKVHRPEVNDYSNIQLPNFKITNHIPPMIPRDQFLVYGDTIYQTYTSMPNRYFDGHAYYKIFKELYDQGHNWISMPPPILQDLESIDKSWWESISPYLKLNDRILWHTATMFKCGDGLVVNSRGPGTPVGLDWMKKNISGNLYHCDKFGHIDHGFFMTNDDTVFYCKKDKDNGDRTPVIAKSLEQKNLVDISPYINSDAPKTMSHMQRMSSMEMLGKEWIDYYFSEWRGYDQETVFITNVLVVDSENIIFGQEDDKLFLFLESQGINCHLAFQRHSLFWEGGIHCITLDIKRKGNSRKILLDNDI